MKVLENDEHEHSATRWRREMKAGDRERKGDLGIVDQAYYSDDVQTWVDLLRSRSHWQDSCWLWMGETTRKASWVWAGMSRQRVNRITAVKLYGLDHTGKAVSLCGEPTCVNPDHVGVKIFAKYVTNDIEP